jgi:hypothetical protein
MKQRLGARVPSTTIVARFTNRFVDAVRSDYSAEKPVFTELNALFLDEESARHHAPIGWAEQLTI